MRKLRHSVINPVESITIANENSDLKKNTIELVQLENKELATEDLQNIIEFRNTLSKKVDKVLIKDKLNSPLEDIYTEVTKLTDGIIAALEQANVYNDDDTGYHMKRLGMYSRVIAEAYGLPEDFISEIERYASLHDVGKIGIPDSILKKPGRLSPEEWLVMKRHSKIGYDILHSVGLSPLAQNIALYHHERWNGIGYPAGLKGEAIPIEARIVAIADVFDALVNKRVYKPAFTREKVEEIILSETGTHFDPTLGQIAYEKLDDLYAIFESNLDD